MKRTLALCLAVLACAGSEDAPPLEANCFDGIDDNGDGLEDCRDPTCGPVAECVAVAPGFQLGTRLGAAEACPDAFPDADLVVGQGLVAPSTCGACTCENDRSECYTSMSGFASSDCTGAPLGSVEVSTAFICSGMDRYSPPFGSVSIGAVVRLFPQPCAASNPTAPTSWSEEARFCGTIHLGGGCGPGMACAPRAASHCALAAGTRACPAGYAAANGAPWYASVTDGRVCPCTCDAATGMSCDAVSADVMNDSCGEPGTPAPLSACIPGEFGESVFARMVGGPGGSCAPHGPGPMTGAAVPADVQTLCCVP